jgi:hypothetical protein
MTGTVYRDSSAGIATRYELDGPGIESRWGARLSAPVQTGPGAYPASCIMGTGSFPGVKRPGRGADHPPLTSAGDSRICRAIPLLPLWAFVACSRVTFTLLYIYTYSVQLPYIYKFYFQLPHKAIFYAPTFRLHIVAIWQRRTITHRGNIGYQNLGSALHQNRIHLILQDVCRQLLHLNILCFNTTHVF